jgi:hypothetical protein
MSTKKSTANRRSGVVLSEEAMQFVRAYQRLDGDDQARVRRAIDLAGDERTRPLLEARCKGAEGMADFRRIIDGFAQ